MLDQSARAALAVARARAGAAHRAARKAARALAQAADGFDPAAHITVTRPADIDLVAAEVRRALTEHREVDVVVLTPAASSPSPNGAQTKETVA